VKTAGGERGDEINKERGAKGSNEKVVEGFYSYEQ